MTDFQAEKDLVRRYHDDIAKADANTIGEVLSRYVSPDWHWRGMHPFHEQHGPENVARVFWSPLMKSMTRIQRLTTLRGQSPWPGKCRLGSALLQRVG